MPGLLGFALSYLLGEDRDEGRGERAARDEEEEQVGDLECPVVDVCGELLSELVGDNGVANESEEAAREDRGHHDAGRPRNPSSRRRGLWLRRRLGDGCCSHSAV